MPCSCPLVHKDFRKFSNREPRAPKKSLHYSGSPQRHLPDPVRPAIPCLPALTTSSIVLRMALRNAGHPASQQILPSSHRLTGKSFWKGGRGEGEPFSKKVFLPASFSLFKSLGACLPSPKQKNPRRSGDKKRPPRAVSCKGVSNNLWQRPTFPHDVMQYHRRWRA